MKELRYTEAQFFAFRKGCVCAGGVLDVQRMVRFYSSYLSSLPAGVFLFIALLKRGKALSEEKYGLAVSKAPWTRDQWGFGL